MARAIVQLAHGVVADLVVVLQLVGHFGHAGAVTLSML